MEQIGYKVVRVAKSGALIPATKIANQSFRYRVGETTRINPAIHGPMGVFSIPEAAWEFLERENHAFRGPIAMEVLKVKYVESREKDFWKRVWRWRNMRRVATSIKKIKGVGYVKYWGISTPAYTRFASEVTPLEVCNGL